MSFICRYCGLEFKTNYALTNHEKHFCKNNKDRTDISITNYYTDHHKIACKYCGKLFDVATVSRHEAACGNPESKLNKKKQQVQITHDGLNCIYCNKLCKSKTSLAQHEIRCKDNPNRKAFNCLTNYNKTTKGETKETSERVRKAAETLHKRFVAGELVRTQFCDWTNRHHSEATKEKQRIGMINYIENTRGKIKPSYNAAGCKYIQQLNENFDLHFKHAENGGEVQVAGYFLDGYDEENNIAFEYDEYRHYKNVYKNILTDKDIRRMRNIIDVLHCRFVRYNEKLDYLYEIDYDLNTKDFKKFIENH